MSAFVVNQGHIHAMLRAGLAYDGLYILSWFTVPPQTMQQAQEYRRELRFETADRVGAMLIAENVRSVCYRYEQAPTDDLPGPIDRYWLLEYRYDPRGRIPTPVEALKLVACYEYQSCEHPEWAGTEGYAFCADLREKLINVLPGYEEADWEWRDQPRPVGAPTAAPMPSGPAALTPTSRGGPSVPRFPLGRVVMTLALQESLRQAQPATWQEEYLLMLARHLSEDWGEVPPEDRAANDAALKEGSRLLSAYTSGSGVKVWVITEADRSVTTLLRPEDY